MLALLYVMGNSTEVFNDKQFFLFRKSAEVSIFVRDPRLLIFEKWMTTVFFFVDANSPC